MRGWEGRKKKTGKGWALRTGKRLTEKKMICWQRLIISPDSQDRRRDGEVHDSSEPVVGLLHHALET